jgi:hypothetical protein
MDWPTLWMALFEPYRLRTAYTGVRKQIETLSFPIDRPNAPVAQGTEQRTSNPPVAGSNPAGRASKIPAKYRKPLPNM